MNTIKTIKLSELSNMAAKIAAAVIAAKGEYFCVINGEKVRVVAN